MLEKSIREEFGDKLTEDEIKAIKGFITKLIFVYNIGFHTWFDFIINTTQDYTFSFRVPYYVGPVKEYEDNDNNKRYAWAVRKESGRITPWNFDDKKIPSSSIIFSWYGIVELFFETIFGIKSLLACREWLDYCW